MAPGWYEVIGGGFICGNYVTTNLASPDVKFAMNAPNLDEVLPYSYARNAKHGTPLYHSVPSREQMLKYEPYLAEKKAPEVASASAPAGPVPTPLAPAALRWLTGAGEVVWDPDLLTRPIYARPPAVTTPKPRMAPRPALAGSRS